MTGGYILSVLYNLEIFTALKIVYGAKSDGFPKKDFDVNENERGIYLPEILKHFLSKYGYLPVNRMSDSVRFFHPNIIAERFFHYGDDNDLPLIVIGRLGEYHVAIANTPAPDPEIFLILQTPEQVQIMPSDDTISEIIKVMLSGILLKNENAVIAQDPAFAVKLLRENNVDLMRITNNPELRREYVLCFTEETRTFTVAEYIDGEVVRFFFIRDELFTR